MATFTAPTPLTVQIANALTVLRAARSDGDAHAICVASARLDRLIDRYAATTERKGRSSL
ncbi:MAG: hypothetical protein K0U84_18265 [Actinomycetia bacterium]|nr:hypothetical protein [Actinomycetes bacterium]